MTNCRWILQTCIIFIISNLTVYGLVFTPQGGIDGSAVFKCGTSASFNCLSTESPLDIGLSVNNTLVILCLFTCSVNPTAPFVYTYTYNETAGLVSAHVNSLVVADASTLFTCAKGAQLIRLQPIIKVFPENGTTLMTITNNSITVTTGCTRLHNNLIFAWYKTKDKNGTISEFLNYTAPVVNNANCVSSDHCNGVGFSSKYIVDDVEVATYYFIKCVVKVTENGGTPVILISERAFRFADPNTTTSTGKTMCEDGLSTAATLGITCAAVVSVEISVGFTVKCVLLRRKRKEKRSNPISTEVSLSCCDIGDVCAS